MINRVVGRYRGSTRVQIAGAGAIWTAHFAFVYLVAEWSCRWRRPSAPAAQGDGLTALIVAATVLAAGLIILTTIKLAPSAKEVDQELQLVAKLLGAVFVVATILVGVTPLFLGPC